MSIMKVAGRPIVHVKEIMPVKKVPEDIAPWIAKDIEKHIDAGKGTMFRYYDAFVKKLPNGDVAFLQKHSYTGWCAVPRFQDYMKLYKPDGTVIEKSRFRDYSRDKSIDIKTDVIKNGINVFKETISKFYKVENGNANLKSISVDTETPEKLQRYLRIVDDEYGRQAAESCMSIPFRHDVKGEKLPNGSIEYRYTEYKN